MHTAALPVSPGAGRLPDHAAFIGAARAHDWSEALRRITLPRATPHRREDFRGDVVTVVSPQGIEFSLLAGSPQTISGVCDDQPTALWLALLIDGRFLLDRHRADEAAVLELLPGDLMVGATGQVCTLSLPRDFKFLYVKIPAGLLQPRLVELPSLRVATLSGVQGVNGVFAGMLRGIADTLHRLDPEQLRPVETALVEFVIASRVQSAGPSHPAHAGSSRSAKFSQLCEAMEARLGDGALSLLGFAAEQRASPRYIQKLFGDAGSSFSGHLRQRRLERCRDDLANRALEALSIAEICFRWGFNDAAHFSRAFREQFGATPRGYRRQSLSSGARLAAEESGARFAAE